MALCTYPVERYLTVVVRRREVVGVILLRASMANSDDGRHPNFVTIYEIYEIYELSKNSNLSKVSKTDLGRKEGGAQSWIVLKKTDLDNNQMGLSPV